MKTDKTSFGLAVLFAYALGLALWSSANAQSPRSTILDHGFRPDPAARTLASRRAGLTGADHPGAGGAGEETS